MKEINKAVDEFEKKYPNLALVISWDKNEYDNGTYEVKKWLRKTLSTFALRIKEGTLKDVEEKIKERICLLGHAQKPQEALDNIECLMSDKSKEYIEVRALDDLLKEIKQ